MNTAMFAETPKEVSKDNHAFMMDGKVLIHTEIFGASRLLIMEDGRHFFINIGHPDFHSTAGYSIESYVGKQLMVTMLCGKQIDGTYKSVLCFTNGLHSWTEYHWVSKYRPDLSISNKGGIGAFFYCKPLKCDFV